jgi:hypothetical protein
MIFFIKFNRNTSINDLIKKIADFINNCFVLLISMVQPIDFHYLSLHNL